MKFKMQFAPLCLALAAGLCLALTQPARARDAQETPAQEERELILLLKSNADPAQKALACKKLAVCGTKRCVPALAPLLADKQLASWARIALEAIPGSAPDAALRKAMGRLQGRLLVGTINSIGVRHDARAVRGLIKHLNDADPQAGSAAAIALGQIGGARAAGALQKLLASAPENVRPSVAEGCVLCAEKFVRAGKTTDGVKLYEAVRTGPVPTQLALEATRGTILAQKSAGLPLLLEQLRSSNKPFFRLGLRLARELPGLDVTEALAGEMQRSNPDRQLLLFRAVADRGDSVSSRMVVETVRSGPTPLRVAAIGALERQGSVSSVPILLEAAVDSNADVADAGLGALTRLADNQVNSDLLGRLSGATGKTRLVLIELAGRRRIEQALPAIAASADDSDAATRAAAIRALGTLGDEQQVAPLVSLLQKGAHTDDRPVIETALTAISTREGAHCVPLVLPLAQSDDSALRLIALPVLASAGGPAALDSVKAATQDKDDAVRDEAVRTLSTWPNNWPEDGAIMEPLLTLAKDSDKASYKVLALRGCLQFVEGNKQLKNEEKVRKLGEIIPLIQRPEEQQVAFGLLGKIPTAETLDLLSRLAAQPDQTENACSTMIKLVSHHSKSISQEQRERALQAILENSKDEATKKKAGEMLGQNGSRAGK